MPYSARQNVKGELGRAPASHLPFWAPARAALAVLPLLGGVIAAVDVGAVTRRRCASQAARRAGRHLMWRTAGKTPRGCASFLAAKTAAFPPRAKRPHIFRICKHSLTHEPETRLHKRRHASWRRHSTIGRRITLS